MEQGQRGWMDGLGNTVTSAAQVSCHQAEALSDHGKVAFFRSQRTREEGVLRQNARRGEPRDQECNVGTPTLRCSTNGTHSTHTHTHTSGKGPQLEDCPSAVVPTSRLPQLSVARDTRCETLQSRHLCTRLVRFFRKIRPGTSFLAVFWSPGCFLISAHASH